MPRDVSLSDDFVAQLLSKDAKDSNIKHSNYGLQAFLPKRPTNNAPRPNTRFLKNILRETDNHNAALRARETLEARSRLRQIEGYSTRHDQSKRQERERESHNEQKMRARIRTEIGVADTTGQDRHAKEKTAERKAKDIEDGVGRPTASRTELKKPDGKSIDTAGAAAEAGQLNRKMTDTKGAKDLITAADHPLYPQDQSTTKMTTGNTTHNIKDPNLPPHISKVTTAPSPPQVYPPTLSLPSSAPCPPL
ncbi:MAG: hypothetical protein Q9190_007929 [Brigantiaea leucoxantha]